MTLIELSQKLDDLVNQKDEKKKHPLPKWAALYGAGGVTGAGIATGSKATQSIMRTGGARIQALYNTIRKRIR